MNRLGLIVAVYTLAVPNPLVARMVGTSVEAQFPSGTVSPLPEWVVYLFLVSVGAAVSLGAVAYAAKARHRTVAFVRSLIAGGLGSSGSVAMGSSIAGLSFPLTWVEAAVVTGLAFFVGVVVWSVAGAVCFHVLIAGPIAKRYGKAYSVRTWMEFLSEVESLTAWIRRTIQDIESDKVWDEFACASKQVGIDIDGMAKGTRVASMLMQLPAVQRKGAQTETAIRYLNKALSPPVTHLVSRLSHMSLNFTVWRIHESESSVEHLLSLPVEPGQEAGHGRKASFRIWSLGGKGASGSLAGRALLDRKYRVADGGSCERQWERRRLGAAYDAVAAMPVPCNSPDDDPWGVICVESRNGAFPLESHAMRTLMGDLAKTIEALGPVVKRRTIGELVSGTSQSRAENPTGARAVVRQEAKSVESALSGTRGLKQVLSGETQSTEGEEVR